MSRALALAVTAAIGCGRLGFDPAIVTGDGAVTGDGRASGGTCSQNAVPACPVSGATLNGGTYQAGGNTATQGSGLAGSCGGANAAEHTIELIVIVGGTYRFELTGVDFEPVLYLREGSCEGVELACSDDAGRSAQIDLDVTAGQHIIAVIDGVDGACGLFDFLVSPAPGS